MKTVRLIMGMLAILFIAGCNRTENIEIGELRNESSQIALDANTDTVQVNLSMGVGYINLSGSETGNLLEADFTYNVDAWEPKISYTDKQLSVAQSGAKRSANVSINDTRNEWELQLNNDVPIDLSLKIGAGQLDLNMTQLALNQVNIEAGAAKTEIDLNHNWEQDVAVNLKMGVGDSVLHLPSDMGVRVQIDGAVKNISARNMIKNGDTYTNEAYDSSASVLTINIETGVGNITLTQE